ncbi:MAG: GTP-binding protein [Candidatus Lokiarchaeota archaeon]
MSSLRGKVIMLGDPSVGKTSLLARYVDDEFQEEYHATIGANFLIKEIELKNILKDLKTKTKSINSVSLYFWDIGGQTDKLFVTEYYFLQAVGALLVFDILDRKSFESIHFWASKMKELSGDIPFILVGNKKDKKEERKVSKQEALEKAKEFNVDYFETSAKTNDNVDKAFETLSIRLLNRML